MNIDIFSSNIPTMPRKLHPEYEAAIYHLINRGNRHPRRISDAWNIITMKNIPLIIPFSSSAASRLAAKCSTTFFRAVWPSCPASNLALESYNNIASRSHHMLASAKLRSAQTNYDIAILTCRRTINRRNSMCESPSKDSKEHREGTREDIQFLQLLLTHYCHHDTLFWNRVQFVFLLQAAALGGAWKVRGDSLVISLAILFLAMFLSIIWFFIFNRDLQVRQENHDLIKKLAERIQVKSGLGLEQEFRIGGQITDLQPLEKYSGLNRFFGLFDSGVYLWVLARSVVLMRIALTIVIICDIAAGVYLVWPRIWAGC